VRFLKETDGATAISCADHAGSGKILQFDNGDDRIGAGSFRVKDAALSR
jgi:hypothetical protein